MSESAPNLGMMIRALRLGFGWHHRAQAFIRISDNGELFQVECRPLELITWRKSEFPHRAWWSDPGLIDGIKPLAHICRVKKPISFYINQRGEMVK